MPRPERCYRIVEVQKDGSYKTLFHGINGSRKLPLDTWLTAAVKPVRDGVGTTYQSGFHVLMSKEDCGTYLKRFTAKRELRIVPVEALNLRPKAHSKYPVLLAEKIRLLK